MTSKTIKQKGLNLGNLVTENSLFIITITLVELEETDAGLVFPLLLTSFLCVGSLSLSEDTDSTED